MESKSNGLIATATIILAITAVINIFILRASLRMQEQMSLVAKQSNTISEGAFKLLERQMRPSLAFSLLDDKLLVFNKGMCEVKILELTLCGEHDNDFIISRIDKQPTIPMGQEGGRIEFHEFQAEKLKNSQGKCVSLECKIATHDGEEFTRTSQFTYDMNRKRWLTVLR